MKRLLLLTSALVLAGHSSFSAEDWSATLAKAKAKGQTVFWNAWGGDDRTNAVIEWVGCADRKAL